MLRLAFTFLILITTSSALAEEQEKIAVLDLVRFSAGRPPKNLREKERFDAAFARSLEGSGWSVVQATDETCTEGVDCLAALAKRTGADRVLRITGQGSAQYGYKVHIEAFDPRNPRTDKVAAFCDICNPDRMAEIAADYAKQQLAVTMREPDAAKEPPATPIEATPSQIPEPEPNVLAQPKLEEPSSLRWVAWSLIGTGAAAMAFGGFALSQNGAKSGDITARDSRESRRVYSTATLGTACLVSGGVAAIAGVIWLLVTPNSQAGVAASSNHIALHIRF